MTLENAYSFPNYGLHVAVTGNKFRASINLGNT